MERLTYRGTPQMTEEGMVTPSYCDYPVRRIIERLAEYEDIGTVEELKSMKENGAFSALEMAQIAVKLNKLKEYEDIGTVKDFKYLRQSEHGYDNCHNLTCRTKCKKDGYADAVDEFADALKEVFKYIPVASTVIDEVAMKLKRG